MSLNKPHSKQTLLKALHWLDQQPDNWSEHITDSQVAVQMYLKSLKKEEGKSALAKELSPFVKKELKGFVPTQKESSSKSLFESKEKFPKLSFSNEKSASPPADGNELLPKKKEEVSAFSRKSFYLDKFSQKTLEQTKKALNLKEEEEVLRLLIQLGQKSLQKILS